MLKKGYGGCYGSYTLIGNEERCGSCKLRTRCEKKSKETPKGLGALFG